MKNLLNLPHLISPDSVTDLGKIYNTVETQVHSL